MKRNNRVIALDELIVTKKCIKWLECLYDNYDESSYERSAFDEVLNKVKALEEKSILQQELIEHLEKTIANIDKSVTSNETEIKDKLLIRRGRGTIESW